MFAQDEHESVLLEKKVRAGNSTPPGKTPYLNRSIETTPMKYHPVL